MEQKFVSFEEVVEKLGVSSERLHELRESGKLRAYRDGKSWKFRRDEIETMAEQGLPEDAPPSDIGLVGDDDLVEAAPIELEDDDLGLSLADETEDTPAGDPAAKVDSELELDDTDPVSQGSEIDLAGLEDTVTAGASDIALDLDLPEAGPSDSILLSDETLGESVGGSPSTIIGRDKLGSGEDDLELALDDDQDVTIDGSDVKLTPAAGASDVLSSGIQGSGVLDELEGASGGTSAFKDLEEIDLSAESSRILSPEDVAEAKKDKETAAQKPAEDLALDDDLQMADDGSNMGSTDVPILEVEGTPDTDASGSGSEIELASDADLLASDSGGSDLTLDSGDSGINLISPSDSGLALDDIPLEMGGSAILSSLSLEGSDPEISLIPSDSSPGAGDSMAELQTDDDFQLTPMSESLEAEGDSSSQVIALDADMEDFADGAAVLDEDDFVEEDGGVVLSEDFAEAPAGELNMGYAPVAAASASEPSYDLVNILLLSTSALVVTLGGTMMLDMMRNIWSWDETYTLNSSVIEAILGLF